MPEAAEKMISSNMRSVLVEHFEHLRRDRWDKCSGLLLSAECRQPQLHAYEDIYHGQDPLINRCREHCAQEQGSSGSSIGSV